jgi:predicted acetyltransferase
MQVDVVEAVRDDWPVLERLAQYYAYDFSEFLPADVDAAGVFHSISLGDLERPGLQAFLVKVDGKLAGFALVRSGSALSGDPDVTDMEEFFVMRKYRRAGVGSEVAHRLFDRFPGRWEVREVATNVPAQSFWRRTIGAYTGGRYEERAVDDERWRGPVQSFVSGGAT